MKRNIDIIKPHILNQRAYWPQRCLEGKRWIPSCGYYQPELHHNAPRSFISRVKTRNKVVISTMMIKQALPFSTLQAGQQSKHWTLMPLSSCCCAQFKSIPGKDQGTLGEKLHGGWAVIESVPWSSGGESGYPLIWDDWKTKWCMPFSFSILYFWTCESNIYRKFI